MFYIIMISVSMLAFSMKSKVDMTYSSSHKLKYWTDVKFCHCGARKQKSGDHQRFIHVMIHPLETTNVCTKCHSNPFNNCQETWTFRQSNGPNNISIQRSRLLVCLKIMQLFVTQI